MKYVLLGAVITTLLIALNIYLALKVSENLALISIPLGIFLGIIWTILLNKEVYEK